MDKEKTLDADGLEVVNSAVDKRIDEKLKGFENSNDEKIVANAERLDAIDENTNKYIKEHYDEIMGQAVQNMQSLNPKEAGESAFTLTHKPIADYLTGILTNDRQMTAKAKTEHDDILIKNGLTDVVRGVGNPQSHNDIENAVSVAGNPNLIPTTLISTLTDFFHILAPHRQLCQVWHMKTAKGKIIGQATAATAYHHAEAVAPTEGPPTFDYVDYNCEDFGVMLEVSSRFLNEMAPLGMARKLVESLVLGMLDIEWEMFITGNDTNTWLGGLDTEATAGMQSVDMSAVGNEKSNGFLTALGLFGSGKKMPSVWRKSLAWVTRSKVPVLEVRDCKDTSGQPDVLLDTNKCINYPWVANEDVTDGTGYLVAMKAFNIVDVPSLTRLRSTDQGVYATRNSVAMVMHTVSDGWLSTHDRAAAEQAAVKLTNLPTA